MFNMELVTDDMERAAAKVELDQSGFDALREELGPSRDNTLCRNAALSIAYDENDMMKVNFLFYSSLQNFKSYFKQIVDRFILIISHDSLI